MELPRINYGRCNERPYRYVWGTASGASGWLEQIVKIDTAGWHDGRVVAEPGCYAGRAGVRRTAGRASRRTTGCCCRSSSTPSAERSFLLVLDASELTELARAEVPHHIPFGFHGQFAAA